MLACIVNMISDLETKPKGDTSNTKKLVKKNAMVAVEWREAWNQWIRKMIKNF